MLLGERLKWLRQQKNLLQRDVAKALDMAPNAYQRYELGTREPSLERLGHLADLFGVPVDFLLARGIFETWEDVLDYKQSLLDALHSMNPEFHKLGLESLDEIAFANFVAALFAKVVIQGNDIHLYPLLPAGDLATLKIDRPST